MSNVKSLLPLYKRLLGYVGPYRGRLTGGILLGVGYSASNGATLLVVKTVWAKVFEQAGGQNLGWLQALAYAGLVPLVMAVRGVCDFGATYLMNWVGGRVVNDLRVRLFEHLQTLSLDYFTETRTGELISRSTNDVGAVQNSITTVVADLVKQPCTLVVVLATLLKMDWRLTLATLVLFPLCLVPILVYGRRIRKAAKASQQHQASLVSVLHEALVGMRVVKAFGMEEREAADFRQLCRDLFGQRMRVVRSKAISTPLIEMISGVGAALVFLYAYSTGMPASTLVSMALGLFFLYDPVKKLSAVQMQVQESLSAAERVFQVMDQQPSVMESSDARALPPLQRRIHFDDVTFRYGADGVVLDNIDLEIPAGSVVAVVGASGAGKTTLFNLLPRFYDPTCGAVKIDGQDIRKATFRSLRDQIGLVTQETFLFNDTVANNIAYGKPSASREEIISAARRAHAHEFIQQMLQQYDTMIGEYGMKLSGGQRQRLAIARAILKNPPILLLDEATSALDTESERAVQAALDDLMWGGDAKKRHTMLVIAHRLSTVRHADQIIVLDKGQIVERGTHDELLKRGGVYTRLYEMQFNE
jgi:subfamily B ATP-binding cassette protein MsbA